MKRSSHKDSESYREDTLLSAVTSTGASKSVGVQNYSLHTVQLVISGGTPSVQIRTSLDGTNWNVEATETTTSMTRITGKVKFISVNYASGTGTVTALLMSGN